MHSNYHDHHHRQNEEYKTRSLAGWFLAKTELSPCIALWEWNDLVLPESETELQNMDKGSFNYGALRGHGGPLICSACKEPNI